MSTSLAVLTVQAAVLVTLSVPGFLRFLETMDSVTWRLRQAGILGMAATIFGVTASAALAVRALLVTDIHPLVVAAAALIPVALLPFGAFVVALSVDQRRIVVGDYDLDSR